MAAQASAAAARTAAFLNADAVEAVGAARRRGHRRLHDARDRRAGGGRRGGDVLGRPRRGRRRRRRLAVAVTVTLAVGRPEDHRRPLLLRPRRAAHHRGHLLGRDRHGLQHDARRGRRPRGRRRRLGALDCGHHGLSARRGRPRGARGEGGGLLRKRHMAATRGGTAATGTATTTTTTTTMAGCEGGGRSGGRRVERAEHTARQGTVERRGAVEGRGDDILRSWTRRVKTPRRLAQLMRTKVAAWVWLVAGACG